jgi:hypothetical protein
LKKTINFWADAPVEGGADPHIEKEKRKVFSIPDLESLEHRQVCGPEGKEKKLDWQADEPCS